MKENVSPAVVAIVIVIVLAIAALFGWRAVGAGPKDTTPRSMAQLMGGASKVAPPTRH